MKEFELLLKKLLGHEATDLELEVFACFNPYVSDRAKQFAIFNPSQPLFLNIDDEHFVYISNHTNRLRCCLDMATRHLESSACYLHENGTIMLGTTKPEDEKHLRSRHLNYHIYVQSVSEHDTAGILSAVSNYADHISLIRDETPWERLCRVCTDTHTGAHITASSARLFKPYENGLLFIIPDHHHVHFNNEVQKMDSAPVFIGKTVSYPLISLDNEKGLLEIPLLTLKNILQAQIKTGIGKYSFNPEEESSDTLIDFSGEPQALDSLFEYIRNEESAYPAREYTFSGKIPNLRIDAIPLSGLSFTPNGIELHTLSNIVDLHIKGLKPLALSYYLETTAETPQEIELSLSAIKKSAKLFGIPLANNCLVAGKKNHLTLFFVSKKIDTMLPNTFQGEGDFICILGDPNGVLKGSAYAQIHGDRERYTPPGVMSGTLAALVDVINECKEKGCISSALMIRRGGLISALKKASANGLGASIYSERKGPIQVFIFGEPQAAAIITLKEKYLIDLARITSNYNLTSTTIGRVNIKSEITINNEKFLDLNDKKMQ